MSAATSLRRPDAHRTYAGRFVAFTDALLLGVLVLVGSLPLVTWFVALAAGVDLARAREERDTTVGVRAYARRWRGARGSGMSGIVVPTLALALAVVDSYALRVGLGERVGLAVVAAAALCGAVALRVAAAWRPGVRWGDAARDGLRAAREDLAGTLLLVVAVVVVVALVRWVPPLSFVAAGPLCVATAGVSARAERLERAKHDGPRSSAA